MAFQCCCRHPWTVVLREWRLSKRTFSLLPESLLSVEVSFVLLESIISLFLCGCFIFLLSGGKDEILPREIQKGQENKLWEGMT